MKRVALTMVLAMVLTVPAVASAASITIFITGLDLIFDGYNLEDSGSRAGWADNLLGAQFVLDGTTLLGNPLPAHADVFIGDVMLPVDGGTAYSSVTGGFGLVTNDGATGIILDWDSPGEVNYNDDNLAVGPDYVLHPEAHGFRAHVPVDAVGAGVYSWPAHQEPQRCPRSSSQNVSDPGRSGCPMDSVLAGVDRCAARIRLGTVATLPGGYEPT